MRKQLLCAFLLLFSMLSFSSFYTWQSPGTEVYYFANIEPLKNKMTVQTIFESSTNYNGQSGFMVVSFYNDTTANRKAVSKMFSYVCLNVVAPFECYARGEFSYVGSDSPWYVSGQQGDYPFWFNCKEPLANFYKGGSTVTPNCTTFASLNSIPVSGNSSWISVSADGNAGDGLYVGTYTANSQVATMSYGTFCVDSPPYFGSTSYYFFNIVDGCVECNPESNATSCTVFGNIKANGHSYRCDNTGHWQSYHECIDGGWYDCGLASAASCPGGVVSNVSVANLAKEIDRISIFDKLGYELRYSPTDYKVGYYPMLATQTISSAQFRLRTSDNREWYLSATDNFHVAYTWNASEMTCTVSSVPEYPDLARSVYVNNDDVSCTLNDSVSNADLTLTVTANITNSRDGSETVLNPQISKAFTIKIVRDMVLLDDFQIVKQGGTVLSVSGHILRFSDLADVPASASPACNISVEMSHQGSVYYNGVVSTGAGDYSNSNYLYKTFDPAVNSSLGDEVKYNATCNATGYSPVTYLWEGVHVGSDRLLYLICDVVPYNLTTDSTERQTEPSTFSCSYQLANISAVSISNLASDVGMKVTPDLSKEYTLFPQLYEMLIPVNISLVNTPMPGGNFTLGRFVQMLNVPYVRTVGYALFHQLDSLVWYRTNPTGGTDELPAYRYIGRYGVFTHPTVYEVKTYTQFEVVPKAYDDFLFKSVDFVTKNKTVITNMKEGDDATCQAVYLDPQGIVSDWKVRLYSTEGISYELSSQDIPDPDCSPSSNSTCWHRSAPSCGPTIGNQSIECTLQWTIYGVNKCLKHADPGNNNSVCSLWKWQFFKLKKSDNIFCEVTLYTNSGNGVKLNVLTGSALLTLSSMDLLKYAGDVIGGFLNLLLGSFIEGLMNFDLKAYVILFLIIIGMPIIVMAVMWRASPSVAGGLETVGRIRGSLRQPGLEELYERRESAQFDLTQRLRMEQLARMQMERSLKNAERMARGASAAARRISAREEVRELGGKLPRRRK